jgi:hypothetical protein
MVIRKSFVPEAYHQRCTPLEPKPTATSSGDDL